MQNIGSHPDHFIQLNQLARAGLLWWCLLQVDGMEPHCCGIWESIVSDPSGSWRLKCDDRVQPLSIAVKEFIPIVIVAAVFGCQWNGKIVMFQVDDFAVMQVINVLQMYI